MKSWKLLVVVFDSAETEVVVGRAETEDAVVSSSVESKDVVIVVVVVVVLDDFVVVLDGFVVVVLEDFVVVVLEDFVVVTVEDFVVVDSLSEVDDDCKTVFVFNVDGIVDVTGGVTETLEANFVLNWSAVVGPIIEKVTNSASLGVGVVSSTNEVIVDVGIVVWSDSWWIGKYVTFEDSPWYKKVLKLICINDIHIFC